MNLDGSTCRSPALHRAIVDHWRESAPANDSDLLPRHRPGTGRHEEFAELLPALRAWRDLDPPETVSTNWLVATNDNEPDKAASADTPPSVDSALEMRPRPEELLRDMGDVEIAYPERANSPAVSVGGDMVMHAHVQPYTTKGVPCAPLARLGALRFANGETFERVPVRGEAGTVSNGMARVGAGALTHYSGGPVRDRFTTWRGSDSAVAAPESIAPRQATVEDRMDAIATATMIRRSLAPHDVRALDAAMTAQNFADIGAAFDLRGRHAEKQGKQILLQAAARLKEILEKEAA
ncbi:hypothetical protein ACO2RV_18650 [Ancylobacter sp. VNQ12]|uniref:hypothetical protein n=1 Tax=Ancylobacter sp. VNQ12 TaxID=3400920 RepID=UPI003BFA9936